MKLTDEEIYQKFIDHMNNPVWEFTPSEHMMPMIKAHISPEEAEFLLDVPTMGSKTLEEIAAIKEMDPDECLEKIKALANKALIYESIRGDSVRYRLFSTGDMFLRPFHIDREEDSYKRMANARNKYFMDGWQDQAKPFPHPGLRAIPINKTIDDTRGILPFEDIVKVIDNYEFYSVSECACRSLHKHDPDYEESPFPQETCLHFNEFGRYFVANGLGREITKEETLEILKKAADAGLVHGISDVELGEGPGVICNCDLDYCVFFKPYHQLGFEMSVDKSNYLVEVAPETCGACGLCVKRCPMDAVQLKFSTQATNKYRKAVQVDAGVCIGCGVCVHKCKTKAITLKRKEQTTRPPENFKELAMQNATAALAAKAKQESEREAL
jgi:NAD-dependent dihydropyrimidine dehydrogenase PreA subunit